MSFKQKLGATLGSTFAVALIKHTECIVCHQAENVFHSHPDALLREERGDVIARLPARDVGDLEAFGRHEDVLVVALLVLVVAEVQARIVGGVRVVHSLKGRAM